jgi:O-antigen ligase
METVSTFGGGERLEASNLYDANDLGLIFVMALPLAILLFETSKGRLRTLAAASGGIIAVAVAVTGSRGAFVGFCVVLPALFFAMSHIGIGKRLGVVAGLIFGLVLGAPDGYWDRVGSIFNPSEDYNVTSPTGRLEIAKRGLGYMWQRPLFGVGLSNFSRAEITISAAARSGERVYYIAPHNTFVQVGAELGLPALLIWVGLIGTGAFWLPHLRRKTKAGQRPPDPTSDRAFLDACCSYLPITFLAFGTSSFFVSHAYTAVFYVPVALLTGVVTFYKPSEVLPRSSRSARAAKGAVRPPSPVSHWNTSRPTTAFPDTLR